LEKEPLKEIGWVYSSYGPKQLDSKKCWNSRRRELQAQQMKTDMRKRGLRTSQIKL
jgi:hypothetical protein